VNDNGVPQQPPQPPQPPAWATPPPVPAGQPPAFPEGTGWAAAAPAPKGRSKLWIVGAIVAGIVALGIIGAIFLPSNAGKVLFTTTKPQEGYSCNSIPNTVTSINVGTHAWVVIVFKEKMDDQPVTLEASLNGETLGSSPISVSETKGESCLADVETDLSTLPAGTYKFTVKHRGEVEAEGTLTIK
jgi:hypothetical protein